jgi:peptidoglycan/LPS O-acetylase OafA/YrhL
MATLGAEDCSPHTPKPAPQVSGRFYRPELDVVRFLAFFLVFLSHSLPRGLDSRTAALPKGVAQVLITCGSASGFGLSLFFTLSAYLICELLLREREATGVVQAKQFYIRRILRIWPLYFAGLAIGLVISFLSGGNPDAIPWAAWSAIMLGNWFVGSHSFGGGPMGVLWSISVEEQFYLFAPWAVKYLNRRSLCGFGIALIVLSNAQLFFLGTIRVYDFTIWTNSFVQFQNFAAGLLLCLALRGRSPRISLWLRLALIAACACCWYYACHMFNIHYSGDADPGSWPLIGGYGLAGFGCVLLLLAFLGLDRKVFPSWAIYLGRISYGLYVFHDLAMWAVGDIFHLHHSAIGSTMTFVKGACALGLTLLFASLSYRFFETPFLRMKKRHEIIESRPV